MGFCNCSMFCCASLCVHSSFAIILMGKRELVAFSFSFFSVFLVSHDCCVALPHGATGVLPHGSTGLTAICDCDMS